MVGIKLTIAALAAFILVSIAEQPVSARPPRQQQQLSNIPPKLAPAPEQEPYGWWYSKTPDSFNRPNSLVRQAAARSMADAAASNVSKIEAQPPTTDGIESPEAASRGEALGSAAGPKPKGKGQSPAADDKEAAEKPAAETMANPPMAAMPASHSFARNRSPVQSLYLAVAGGAMPELPPEVYYRFTARTMERHGGVALGSSYHQAKVARDSETWRADLFGASFGTVEVYSRFKIGDSWVYSQHNYLHFLLKEDAEKLVMPARVELPSDWPQFVFPTSSYNDMPFRGAQTGEAVEFEVQTQTGKMPPVSGLVLEENFNEAVKIGYSALSKKFSYTPPEDKALLEAGGRSSKKALALIKLPGSKDILTFSFDVSLSRWSSRKLGWGLGALGAVAIISTAIVFSRRRRFKYNDRD